MGWLRRLRNTISSDRLSSGLDEELRAHRVADYQRRGLSAAEAEQAAQQRIGNVTAHIERTRDADTIEWLATFARDIRFALRLMRRSPGFTAVAVLSLALGIGANTAIFSVIDGLMLRTLPVPHPEEIVNFTEYWPGSRPRNNAPTWEFTGLRDGIRNYCEMAAVALIDRSNITVNRPASGGMQDAGRARVAMVSGNYFPMFQVAPAMGRTFTPDDDRAAGGNPVMVVSHDFWVRNLNRAPDALSYTITVNRTTFTVVGVMPAGFTGDWVGRPTELWTPMTMQGAIMIEAPNSLTKPNDYWLRLIGRLKPGVTVAQASAALAPVYQHLLQDAAGPAADAQALRQIAQGRMLAEPGAHGYSPQLAAFTQSVRILTAVMGLVLLVACANLAGMQLSRSTARRREFAVRLAIGASGSRLARQLLAESVLLASFGGILGAMLAAWGTRALATAMAAGPVQMFWAGTSWISFDVHLDTRSLLFTAALSLIAGVLFGMAPMLSTARLSLSPSLSNRAVVGGPGGRFHAGKGLVAAQVALSLIVLTTAVLLLRTLNNLRTQDLGFQRDHLLLVWTQPSSTGRPPAGIKDLWHDVQQRLSALPGVESASASNMTFLNGNVPVASTAPVEFMRVQGQQPHLTSVSGFRTFILPDFFRTLGVPLLAGREFTERDNETAPPVVILNESMARFYFGGDNPIGRHVAFGQQTGYPVEVVGVVRDFESGSPRAAGMPRMRTFFPYRDRSTAGNLVIMCVTVRTHRDPVTMADRIRTELRAAEPSLAVLKINTVDRQLDDVLAQERLLAALATFFGGVAVLLACVGLYALLAHMTVRRTSEIGVRMALGATSRGVLTMVLREGLWLVLAGVVVGIPAAIAGTRWVESRLFGVRPTDPVALAGAALLLAAVAALAGLIPARRASRIDPIAALREE
ncbi:MAG TPA: ABC transporter permease [Bryobacteraceae bacterium]|nr:ABC transporter permease [Bryobacteraceae bacterium]